MPTQPKRDVICEFSFRGEKVRIITSANPNRALRDSFFKMLENYEGADAVQIYDRVTAVEYGTIRRGMDGKVEPTYKYDPMDYAQKPRLSVAALLKGLP